ncbi:MAG: hypothetical protein IPK64_20950 [bacterium]|nr:hypothetical protein [bacterium]
MAGATATVWTARTGGTQITDLTDIDGDAITLVTSDADGGIRFYGVDGDKDTYWLDTGTGARIAVRPADLTGEIGPTPDLTIGTVTTGTAAATITGTDASPVLNLTLPSAGANGVNTAAIQDGAVTAAKLATTGRFTFPTGAANGYGFTSGASHLSGTGTPEGVVTAAPGSSWLQIGDAVTVSGNLLWRKATGTGNTGWVPEGALADTGWRNVLTWAGGAFTDTPLGTPHADWTCIGGGHLYIRRISNTEVQYYCYGNLKSPATGGSQPLLPNLPSAFKGLGSFPVSTSAGFALQLAPTMDRAGDSAWVDAYLPMSWTARLPLLTSDAWPSSLPGTAI